MKKPVKIFLGAVVFALVAAVGFLAVNKGTELINSAEQIISSNQSESDDTETDGGSGRDSADILSERDDEGTEENETDVKKGTLVNLSGDTKSGVVSRVAENAMPAIVAINCTAYYRQQDFFGRPRSYQGSGAGSGIIIGQNDSEVLIVTNAHVVSGDEPDVKVVFCNDKEYDATIKGSDEESDLSVLSVKIRDIDKDTLGLIKIASLGSSDDTKVGQMVVAIGNALGYGQSVTVGYISAKGRKIEMEDSSKSMSLIQTDAAINPGNSGGALINLKGEIIGINSAKFSDTDVEGMGYAIPIDDALPVIKALMNEEEVEHKRAYLGIKGINVSEEDSEAFNLPAGIYIREVSEGSPAEKAGIMQGQIIIKCNDKTVDMDELESILESASAGDRLILTVKQLSMGKYEERDIEVILTEKTENM